MPEPLPLVRDCDTFVKLAAPIDVPPTVTELTPDVDNVIMTGTTTVSTDGVTPVNEVQTIDISSLNGYVELYDAGSPGTDLLNASANDWDTAEELLGALTSHPSYADADFTLGLNTDSTALEITFKSVGPDNPEINLRDLIETGPITDGDDTTAQVQRFSNFGDITTGNKTYELFGTGPVNLFVTSPADSSAYTVDQLVLDFKDHPAYDDAYFTLSVENGDLVLTHKEVGASDSYAWLSSITDSSITTTGVTGVAETQLIDASSIDIVHNETYVFQAGGKELSYVATKTDETMADIVAGLKKSGSYNEQEFSISELNGTLTISFANVGAVSNEAKFFRQEGAQLADVE